MTTIAEAMDRAARRCSITPPASWTGATALSLVEMREDFLLETVDELLDRVDWPSPIGKVQTITGDGSTEFDLNSDFKRMKRSREVYESSNTRRFGIPVHDEGTWQYLTDIGTAAAYRYFRTAGYDGAFTIEFYPATSSGDSIQVAYVSELWMATSAGVVGSAWTNDTDLLLLPRRLIELGVEHRFKQRKGMDYAPALAEYELRLGRAINDANLIRRVDGSGQMQTYHPSQIPVPDFIPPS